MELALNLSWLAMAVAMVAGVVAAERRGRLRVSLRVALGCAALLAVVLLPAISMTDDLQQTLLNFEERSQHLLSSGLASAEGGEGFREACLLFTALLMMAAWFALRVMGRVNGEQRECVNAFVRMRPYAANAPPA